MVRSDKERLATLPGGAAEAFTPLTVDPKNQPDGGDEAPLVPTAPRTELGRRLWDIRGRIVGSGLPLLNWDQIAAEVAARRGERA